MSEKVGEAVSKFDYEDKKGSSSRKQKESPVHFNTNTTNQLKVTLA